VQELELDAPEVKIGRSPDNAVVLADDGKGVSRVHAIIRVENGDHVLYDGNSRNGTFVDGQPIKRTPMQPGQDFVIGPYRLIFGAGDYSGSMPTVVATRTTPPPVEAPREGTARGGSTAGGSTARRGGASQTKSGEGSTKSRPAAGAKPVSLHDKPALPVAYIAVAAVAVIVIIAAVIWQMLPQPVPPPQEAAVQPPVTTTIPEAATTSAPTTTIDPHSEQIAQATLAMEAAETTVAAKNFNGAIREFNRILKEQITPILAVDAQYAPAVDLETRLKTRISEVQQLRVAATPAPPPVTRAPDDVSPRPGESDADYRRRNEEVKVDYALAKKYFNEGDFLSASKLFSDLLTREPGYLDVSAYVKNAQEGLDRERLQAMNEGLRLEGEGHKQYLAKNLSEAASQLTASRKAFERAAALQAPGVEKQLADNMERRRLVGRAGLALAYTHANQRNRAEAQKWFQLVIDLLPAGDPVRQEAVASLRKIAP
jgi:tetratricopeptide (TPR) repeat protein